MLLVTLLVQIGMAEPYWSGATHLALWQVLLPSLIGFPLTGAWTWAKIWAVKKTENAHDKEEAA